MAQVVRKYRKYSREDKALFFEARERLGTVSAAARQLGINTQTAFTASYPPIRRTPEPVRGTSGTSSQDWWPIHPGHERGEAYFC